MAEAPAEVAFFSPFVEEILKPIPGGKPCGEKVTYDDDYLKLKAEVDRLGSAAGGVDFDQIVELGRKVLTEKSKDLMTIGYLGLGLTAQRGNPGVPEALAVCRGVLETFWEGAHPVKVSRRRSALQFLADKLKDHVERLEKFTEADKEPLEAGLAIAQALQTFTMAKMEENAPAFSGLTAALRTAIRRVPKPAAPTPQPTPTASPPQSSGATPAPSRPATAGAAPAELNTEAQAQQALIKALAFLRDKEETNPVPYRLLRTLQWDKIGKEPPAEEGKTPLEAPMPELRDSLVGILDKGDFALFLARGEAAFQQDAFKFWLDLQRMLATAAGSLGVPYKGVQEAILLETAIFLRRTPGMASLAYSDGTPFADTLTQAWIEANVMPLLSGGSGGGSSVGGGGSEHVKEQFKEAQQKLLDGDLGGALAMMQRGGEQDATQQDRFQRRLHLAMLCVRGGQPDVARAVLEGLDEEVTHHALQAWDPGLALQVWSNLYTCYTALLKKAKSPQKEVYLERAAAVFDKVSQVDAGYALTL